VTMLADRVDFVIGVDTHKDSHTAVVLSAAGAAVSKLTVAASGQGTSNWWLSSVSRHHREGSVRLRAAGATALAWRLACLKRVLGQWHLAGTTIARLREKGGEGSGLVVGASGRRHGGGVL
jgi:hypothetical protein